MIDNNDVLMSTSDERWLRFIARLDGLSDAMFRSCFAKMLEVLERR